MIALQDSIETTDDRSPSERDLQIYGAVRIDGRRQVDVAAEFEITQGRVSQIVRKVHRWRVGMGIAAELERRDRRAVEQWLEQLRIDKLYEETMELFRRSCEPRRKERQGKDHRGEWSSESLDHQPGNLQCLKFAGRLIELRRQLDADPPLPDPSANSPRSRMDEYEAFRLLVDLRNDAIRRGDVPAGESSECVVQRLMQELVGQAEKTGDWGQESGNRATEVAETAANEPASINNISAAGAGDEATEIDAIDCREATSGNSLAANNPAAGANIREIFSAGSTVQPAHSPMPPRGEKAGLSHCCDERGAAGVEFCPQGDRPGVIRLAVERRSDRQAGGGRIARSEVRAAQLAQ